MNRYEIFEKKVLVDYFDEEEEGIEVTCHKEDDGEWLPDMASFRYDQMTPSEAKGVWELAYKYANQREYNHV